MNPGFERAELEALFVRLEKRVFNVVYRWLWDRQEARDVTQEAFLKLWRMRERVDRTTVEPLVFRIAVNAAANRRRARRMRRWVGLDDAADAAAPDERGARDVADDVRRAVDALPEKLKRVIVLGELGEMSYPEIATALGIPEGTVASRRNAALAKLREQLGAEVAGA